MTTINTTKPIVALKRSEEVTYVEHRILWGLLSWKTRVNADRINDDIIIWTMGNTYDKVFIDGKEYELK